MKKSVILSSLTVFAALFCFAEQNTTYTSKTTPGYDSTKTRMITPNASPVVKGGADIFIDVDFIYWTARQSGLSFAYTQFVDASVRAVDNQVYPRGNNLFVNNKYSPGFKAGFGIITDHDGWDLYLQYTWFRTNPKSSLYSGSHISPNRQLNNSLIYYDRDPFFDISSETVTVWSQWKYRFNNFDLELGRNFFVSHYLTLRPHFGLKGGWQRQNWNSYWTSSNTIFTTAFNDANYNIYQKQKQWNIGLRAGIDTSWMFTKNWSLYGDFALSGLWTQFTITRYDIATTTNGPDADDNAANFQTYNQRAQYHIVTPVLELALGLRFDWWFSDDDYRFRLQAGWENQIWFSQNNFEAVYAANRLNSTRTNQLTFQGLTIEARIDF